MTSVKKVSLKGREKISLKKALESSNLYELQQDGVLILNSDKDIVYANKAFFFICDVRPFNFKTKKILFPDLLDFEEKYEGTIIDSLVNYSRNTFREVNLCIHEKYCLKVSLSINSLVDDENQVAGAILFIKDLSEEWRLHMKYKGIIKELESKNEELNRRADVFRKFVPEKFIAYLSECQNDYDFNLHKVQKGIFSVMFIDVRNFTQMSERMSSQESIALMNSLFSIMEPIIKDCKGFIDKYIGDGLMALFEWSREAEDSLAPIHAAIKICRELDQFNEKQKLIGKEEINIGIGISTGNIILGMVGTEERFESTAMGNAVNLASRMEFMTKHYKCRIIISEYTLHALHESNPYEIRQLGFTQVKGFREKIASHEVFDNDPRSLKEHKMKCREDTDAAIRLMEHREYDEAIEILESLAGKCGEDHLPKLLFEEAQLEKKKNFNED